MVFAKPCNDDHYDIDLMSVCLLVQFSVLCQTLVFWVLFGHEKFSCLRTQECDYTKSWALSVPILNGKWYVIKNRLLTSVLASVWLIQMLTWLASANRTEESKGWQMIQIIVDLEVSGSTVSSSNVCVKLECSLLYSLDCASHVDQPQCQWMQLIFIDCCKSCHNLHQNRRITSWNLRSHTSFNDHRETWAIFTHITYQSTYAEIFTLFCQDHPC